jgi:hypothetical protein
MRLLPEEFLAYHARGARLQGPVSSIRLGWFQLWPLSDICALNDAYKVPEYAPELLGFGSDGGGEMLAFDAKYQIVQVPFIGMDTRHAQLIAPSWRAFETILFA